MQWGSFIAGVGISVVISTSVRSGCIGIGACASAVAGVCFCICVSVRAGNSVSVITANQLLAQLCASMRAGAGSAQQRERFCICVAKLEQGVLILNAQVQQCAEQRLLVAPGLPARVRLLPTQHCTFNSLLQYFVSLRARSSPYRTCNSRRASSIRLRPTQMQPRDRHTTLSCRSPHFGTQVSQTNSPAGRG